MPYWGSKPDDSDFAFDAIGAYIYIIKERMTKDIATVLEKSYPEQSMVASLICLRLLGEQFPKCLTVHFHKSDFAFVVNAFNEWVAKVGRELPDKHRDAIVAEARAEFALWEDRVFKSSG